MQPIHDQKTANKFLEGGVFYPTGHIVTGFESSDANKDAALYAQKALLDGGISQDHMTLFASSTMAREAADNLEHAGILSVGASLPAREMQLELAKDGCDFLMIYAPTDNDQDKVIKLLQGHPLRYAAKYHRLVIEDLLTRFNSSADKKERARVP